MSTFSDWILVLFLAARMVVVMTGMSKVNHCHPANVLLGDSKTMESCNCGETSVVVDTSSETSTDSVSSHAACSPQAQRISSDDTPAANPEQDENVRILLAQLYQSSARSRKLHRPPSSLASSFASTIQQEQQIWTEMKNAISSIEEWKFIQHHSNNSLNSTNSSMVSNDDDDDMSCNAITAEKLFDDNFFERH